ncbi:MAG: GTP-binding protein [Leptospiraceae bacterium]|nr:GTP-binding protein [Leptospiraceae bacterium]
MKSVINIGIFAHIDAGKTTFTERILYEAGQIYAPGSIEDGTTESDVLPEEIRRGISILASVVSFPVGGSYVNLVDTPGHIDFHVQVDDSMPVVDLAIVLIDLISGIKSQTELILQKLNAIQIPYILFINKVDLFPTFEMIPDNIRSFFQKPLLSLFYRTEEGDVMNHTYGKENTPESVLIPFLEWSEELSEKYLENPEKLEEFAYKGLIEGFYISKFIPVFAGSAKQGLGIREFLSFLKYVKCKEVFYAENKLGCIFKKQIHPEYGKISYIRLYKTVKKGSEAFLYKRAFFLEDIRMPGLSGEVWLDEYPEGSVVISQNLSHARIGDYLYKKPETLNKELLGEDESRQFAVVLEPLREEYREKLLEGLDSLLWEDHGLRYKIEDATGQVELWGCGELHIEVSLNRLSQFVGKTFSYGNLKVVRYELIENIAKTSLNLEHSIYGGRDKSGVLEVIFEKTLDFNRSVIFDVNLSEELCSSVEAGFNEGLFSGLYGHGILGLRLRVISYTEPEILSEHRLSLLKIAVISGVKQLLKSGTVQVGPITLFEILAPEEFLGQVLAGVQICSAKITEVDSASDHVSYIKGEAPAEKMLGFASILRNMTKGKGTVSMVTRFDSKNFSYV